ncbi:MAG: OmpH family outer membrane protein [Bacteroidetes bacterium]|nr:OmpH family outer membrane protein [Bacteroidota bacterium]
MYTKRIIPVISGFVALIIIAGIYFEYRIPEICYVDITKVFNEFLLKKELEALYQKEKDMKINSLDSIRFDLEVLSRKILANNTDKELQKQYNALNEIYLARQEEYIRFDKTITEKYDEQIWNQLNQYVKEFGEKKDYDFLLGTHGAGNLMYAKETRDVTDEMIIYVNQRYKGYKE